MAQVRKSFTAMSLKLENLSHTLIALKDFPVESWDPPYCGELPIRIDREGRWYFQDSPIGRERLVQLFSRILKKDGDRHVLVTPAEKVGIVVEDAPFIAVAVETKVGKDGPEFWFSTNVGTQTRLDAEHPLKVIVSESGEPRPYLTVERGLQALLARPVFYELVERAEETLVDGAPGLALRSAGTLFPLGRID